MKDFLIILTTLQKEMAEIKAEEDDGPRGRKRDREDEASGSGSGIGRAFKTARGAGSSVVIDLTDD